MCEVKNGRVKILGRLIFLMYLEYYRGPVPFSIDSSEKENTKTLSWSVETWCIDPHRSPLSSLKGGRPPVSGLSRRILVRSGLSHRLPFFRKLLWEPRRGTERTGQLTLYTTQCRGFRDFSVLTDEKRNVKQDKRDKNERIEGTADIFVPNTFWSFW